MRKLRDSWHWFLFAIPLIAVALSVQYFMRKTYPEGANTDSAVAMKPSSFTKSMKGKGDKMDDKKVVGYGKGSGYTVAKRDQDNDEDMSDNDDSGRSPADAAPVAKTEMKSDKGAKTAKTTVMKSEITAPTMKGTTDKTGTPVKMTGITAKVDAPKTETAKTETAKMDAPKFDEKMMESGKTGANVCSSIEYRGDGSDHTKISKNDWEKVVNVFHEIKGELLTWLEHRQKELPDKTVKLMENQIRTLKLQRPPTMDEPDLAWRGIGVWMQDNAHMPIVKLGGGFVKMMNKQPARAKFELTRLMVQSWAPCELQRIGAAEAWAPLMKCLDVSEQNACGLGTYSEGGWAVSSAVAATISPPGCQVPAFNTPTAAACVKRMPLPLTLSKTSKTPKIDAQSSWKEASR